MKKILVTIFALLCVGTLSAQTLHGDSLAADWRQLIDYLEQTHPDPYTSFGGRVFFANQAERIEQQLRAQGATKVTFARTALAFMSRLGDGHTHISVPEEENSDINRIVFPLQGSPVEGGLMVSLVPSAMSEVLGARIVGLGGVSIDELARRAAKQSPQENIYGAYSMLGQKIAYHGALRELVADLPRHTEALFELPSGEVRTLPIRYMEIDSIDMNATLGLPNRESGVDRSSYMSYGFVDQDERLMLFRLRSIISREAFEMARESKMAGWEQWLERAYRYVLRRPMPENPDEAVAALPSLHEMFAEMLAEMKRVGAPYLIIDLRSNDGGMTPIIYQTLWQLYGRKYFETPMDTHYYTRISPLYLQKYSTTLDEFNAAHGSHHRLGDLLSDSEALPAVDTTAAVYTPERVFVITNASTFSAAFHYAFYLWKLGATIVGVPTRQAPNTFMEVTPFTLPYTHLEGSISNAMQVFLPADDPRAKVFWPDVMLSPQQYAKYNFDQQSEILYLIDSLGLQAR